MVIALSVSVERSLCLGRVIADEVALARQEYDTSVASASLDSSWHEHVLHFDSIEHFGELVICKRLWSGYTNLYAGD